jgi:uncharacterized damage-inducible protein DinB
MTKAFPPIDTSPHWLTVQENLLRIVELIPDEKLNWTPKEDLWNSRGILIHISDARDRWLADRVRDGDPYPNIWTTARTRDDLKRELVRTFERLQHFIASQEQLDRVYTFDDGGETYTRDGHYVAFHLLEHDIHHRAELLQRLALMGVQHDIDI